METKATSAMSSQINVKCKICDMEIAFNCNDANSYLSRTEHKDFFGMQLITYRVQHQVNGEQHLNAVLIDSQNLFRGYVDAYIMPIIKDEQMGTINFSDFLILENDIEPMHPNKIFSNFIIMNLNGWVLEVSKIKGLKTDAILKNIQEKIVETKGIYEVIPQPLNIVIADLECFIWIEGRTHLIITIKRKEEIEKYLTLFSELTKKIENRGIIPKRRIFNILSNILTETTLAETRSDLILRLLSDDLLYSNIKIKYPERIKEITPKIAKRFNISKAIIEELLSGSISVIDLFVERPVLISQFKTILETLDFIDRRKLLE